MTIRKQLIQEIQSSEDNLLEQTLNFLRFLKTKEGLKIDGKKATESTGKNLIEHLNQMDDWSGNDLEECYTTVKNTLLPAEFDTFNPFD